VKKILSALFVSFLVVMFGRVVGKLDISALLPGAQTLEAEMSDLADSSPFVHAVLSDHMDETRQIYSKLDTAGEDGTKNAIASVLIKYGFSALSRTSDAHAIDVMNKGGVALDVLAKRYPEGCRYFLRDEMPPGTQSMPDVTASFRSYQEARRVAYEDGKSHEPIAALSPADVFGVAMKKLDVSLAEIGLLLDPDKIPDVQLCSILKRLVNVQALPEAERAAWARGYISMGAEG